MINVITKDDISIVEAPNKIGIGFKDEDFTEFKKLINDLSGKIIINLENTKAIDSSTIGVILKKYVDLKDAGNEKHIALCSMKNVVKRSLEIIPIDKYIKCFETLDEAIEYLKGV